MKLEVVCKVRQKQKNYDEKGGRSGKKISPFSIDYGL